ncbi:Polyamine aminopropyltransferase [Fundidesulfovibrio magnetotacticus]|uniref:Polyamine aminopropyltransferase n=1 Tax=Fundidesulfovibrio magnetotacticus TaxID=2730080 RepID=A0A6V8LZ16_9BACT|nr:fused MFS/spermidine synthase [Fundidesulfovibrio magnetotacticus]GFK95036.1 Polyamine aminopropyltransferase [Fundidesulfovibrio magnetotacticus]
MLEIVVFLCGAVVMVIELAATRILAPYLGTSTVVWTSVIGVILAALSLGYWWGGRLADRNPSRKALSGVILAAAACTAAIGFSNTFVVEMIRASGTGLHASSLLAVACLFGPASTLLGMIAPFAARIRLTDTATAGRTVGRLYALSTAGSIVGVFAGGFFLIAYFGSSAILFLTAAVLAGASALCHAGRWPLKALAALACVGLYLFSASQTAALTAKGVVDVDTPYQRAMVYPSRDYTTGRTIVALSTGPEGVQGGVYPDEPEALALNYTRFLPLASHFAPGMRRVLVLGGGAYAFPKYVLRSHPAADVDVVELDPGITALARAHFFLPDDPRLTIRHEDARTFLNANTQRYDVIVVDVFNSAASIPFHLATVETVRRLALALADDGVLIVNTIGALQGPRARLYKSFAATYSQAFPQVHAVRTWSGGAEDAPQNLLLVCFKTDAPRDWTSADPAMAGRLDRRIPPPDLSGALVLTDEYAPVERYLTGW